MTWHQDYLERYYVNRRGWKNGTEEFHGLCETWVPLGGRILEIGAGPSNPTSRYLATLGEVTGIDPDPDVKNNDALAEAVVMTDDGLPLPDDHFDACISNYVVEHVANPDAHLREIRRVLKPSAPYIFRTPNRYHYVALVSSLTPHWFHRLVANRLRGLSADSHEPYPTVYALNTEQAVRAYAPNHGFDVAYLRLVEKEPSYGAIARPIFLAGMAYERIVNATDLLAQARSNLFVVLRSAPN